MLQTQLDATSAETPARSADLQRKYRQKRMRWARAIGRPYSWDIEKPDPGALDAAEEDNG